jgi:N,N-dimethylformamidase
MRIVGYSSRLVVAPGEPIEFMVSARQGEYRASLVELIHGNPDPAGPGFKEAPLAAAFEGRYPGTEHALRPGSCVRVASAGALDLGREFGLEALIWPTLPGEGEQALISRWSEAEQRGFALSLDAHGNLTLRLGGGEGAAAAVIARKPLRARTWYRVGARLEGGVAVVWAEPAGAWFGDRERVEASEPVQLEFSASGLPTYIAARDAGEGTTACHFNGKIEAPAIMGPDGEYLACWSFGERFDSRLVLDRGPYGLHGETVNAPLRAVPGARFSGRTTRFLDRPEEFAAIWFHDDDLEDAGWPVAFDLVVPDGLRSGIYAAKLECDGGEDHVPFFVRPPRGRVTSRIALVLPSYTYLAYANDTNTWRGNPAITPSDEILARLGAEDHYAMEQRLKSTYDLHTDGSGVAMASSRRPLVNMRPRYHLAILGAPHAFSSDLHLTDWLRQKGFDFDVITDEDIHFEGASLLRRYAVLLTGTHPEYTTGAMLQAYEDYLGRGGRLMYLGGNGFYWVISVHPETPHVIELRRGRRGTGLWRGAPGEDYHATTGELGGLWRDRGLAPQRLVGVGFVADGIGKASGYRRLPDSHDPRAGFIFEGIGANEIIGDFGLVLGGAGGNEVDRCDAALGTPAHALRLATTVQLPDEYHHVIEEVTMSDSSQHASVNPNVYGDLAFFETPGGGAVFSVGSMSWCGALSHAGYDNNVSRISENVLRRFSDPTPFPEPPL